MCGGGDSGPATIKDTAAQKKLAELAAKRNPKKATKNYDRQIENFRKKRTDLLNKNKKLFKNWYEQNKDDNYIDFIDWVIKELEDPKLKGKGYYHGPKGKIKY